jgi:hypothetical protein
MESLSHWRGSSPGFSTAMVAVQSRPKEETKMVLKIEQINWF